MRGKTEDCLFEEGIWNEPWNKVGSFHPIAWLISDAPTVTRDTKEQTFLVTSQIRLLSKEKRNHGNSARLTREQWRGSERFRKFAARHNEASPIRAVDWLLPPPPYLTAILFSLL